MGAAGWKEAGSAAAEQETAECKGGTHHKHNVVQLRHVQLSVLDGALQRHLATGEQVVAQLLAGESGNASERGKKDANHNTQFGAR